MVARLRWAGAHNQLTTLLVYEISHFKIAGTVLSAGVDQGPAETISSDQESTLDHAGVGSYSVPHTAYGEERICYYLSITSSSPTPLCYILTKS